jgi:hypothetical protein
MSPVPERIRHDTHEFVREAANRTGRSMPEILDQAVEELRRLSFLQDLAEDFTALKKNPRAWQDELEERAAWDGALRYDLDLD